MSERRIVRVGGEIVTAALPLSSLRGDSPRTFRGKRACGICGTRLSSYNPVSDRCYLHTPRRREVRRIIG